MREGSEKKTHELSDQNIDSLQSTVKNSTGGRAITASPNSILRVNILNLTYKLYLKVKYITFIEFLDHDYIQNHTKINEIGYKIQKI